MPIKDMTPLSISTIQQRCAERLCECLSPTYVNAHALMRFKCITCQYEWESNANRLTRGKGCPKCWSDVPYALKDLQLLAESRGGSCLSSSYKNVHDYYEWQCALNHTWSAKWNDIKKSSWCPHCNQSGGVGERICRSIFEQMFGSHFPKTRPTGMVSARGTKIEFDGYNKELALAFEHQGTQHTQVDHIWKGQKTWLHDNDERKRVWCREQGILLIEIPEVPGLLKVQEVPEFIRQAIVAGGRPLPQQVVIDLRSAYSTSREMDALKELRAMAAARNGALLSSTYLGSRAQHEWKCHIAEHQSWRATPYTIKIGHWCGECGSISRWIKRRADGTDKPNRWMGRGKPLRAPFTCDAPTLRLSVRGIGVTGYLITAQHLLVNVLPTDHAEQVLSCSMSLTEARSFWKDVRDKAREQDLSLFLVMPDDSYAGWLNRITSLQGKASATIGARECIIGTCGKPEADAFYDQFHVQGSGSGRWNHILKTPDGEAVAMMSFSEPFANRASGADILLTRFAVKDHVPGAASRLLKAARIPGQTVLTFSDNRYAVGGLYSTLGFAQAGAVPASYRYVRDGRVHSKESLQIPALKEILHLPIEALGTEAELARRAGFDRLYDAGKVRWLLT